MSKIRFGDKFNLPRERLVPVKRNIPFENREFFEDVLDRLGEGKVTTTPPPGIPPTQPPGTSPPADVPPAPPQPPATVAPDLRPLMAFMPIANDGQVITAEYHNSLRAAILGIAERLGVGTISPTNVFTFAPIFLRRGTDPEWALNEGFATKPIQTSPAAILKSNAVGWFPVQLPQGSRLEGMIVTGRRTGTMEAFNVTLSRQKIADPTQTATQIISIPLKDAPDPFEQTGAVDFSGGNPGAGSTAALVAAAVLETDFRLVDNDNYKYLIRAQLVNADPPAVAQINSIQVVCREV